MRIIQLFFFAVCLTLSIPFVPAEEDDFFAGDKAPAAEAAENAAPTENAPAEPAAPEAEDDFFADDANYQLVSELAIELYTDFKDLALEAQVEAALADHELAWVKEEAYLDDQRMHMTTWTTEVVLTSNGGNENA